MQSPTAQPGWTGMEAPRTVERKRKGGYTDEVLPTPPRVQLPTPETLRRTAKRVDTKVSTRATQQQQLPTPQTLARHSRKISITHALHPGPSVPEGGSPSGHTTFFLSSGTASRERDRDAAAAAMSGARRRPGLTFAQQMGLVPGSASGRVGIGMGGSKSGSHKKDKIRLERPIEDESPFLAQTTNVKGPAINTANGPLSSPLNTAMAKQTLQSPALVNSAGSNSLLTPPPTFPHQRLGAPPPIPSSPTTVARAAAAERRARADALKAADEARTVAAAAEKARREKIQKMRDEDDNPFLVKAGESSSIAHRHVSLVDETKDTVTYVFRGTKREFANPFNSLRSRKSGSASNLDTEHPDYEPDPCPPPRLLWPKGPEPANSHAGDGSGSDTETEESVLPNPNITPPRQRSRRLPTTTRPSPPSSPIPTPMFATSDGESLRGPSQLFTSDDEFVPEGQEVEEDEEDLGVHARRGLLFGQGKGNGFSTEPRMSRIVTTTGEGIRRRSEGSVHAEQEQTRAKKARSRRIR
ncbi:hypothetical protein BD324DRAFT_622621 [Kockovaella imperatae]|uniref:Uncharacterized protein n=1 Tax=Kockovaella imperatae TaxID=4999 RepID=A0A1Y1UHS4_9TREE|nr:hypothetical protein BD324DRAFT_622621 [Kockovaella imperatae]ORX37610.1 hypothetical protein BD324DRAFT_622621 [Kockovaella imperatae]